MSRESVVFRAILLAVVAVLPLFFSGCVISPDEPRTEEDKKRAREETRKETTAGLEADAKARRKAGAMPRGDQKYWLNEDRVTRVVGQTVAEMRFGTHRKRCVDRLGALLAEAYGAASDRGQDVDGGVRAMCFVKFRFNQLGGKKRDWRPILDQAHAQSRSELLENPIPRDWH